LELFGYKLRIELFLCIIFFIVPIILPLFADYSQPSLSEYYYTSQKYTYITLLSIIGILTILDGVMYSTRRYNILIGLSMIGVVVFPVEEFRITHDIFAIIFFVGNAFIVTYYSKLLVIAKKMAFLIIIILTLLLLMFDIINLYVAETMGMLSMSYFMFTRYSILELRNKIVA
tara:strand:+ start:1855 stop:2373 length:519 start_codon:yes stop_codon:yes gene_type:complete